MPGATAPASPQMWTETGSVDGSRSTSRAALGDDRQRCLDLRRGQRIEVELVGEARRQPPRYLRSVAADEDRDPRLLQTFWLVDRVADVRVRTLERRPAGAEHPADDLELIGKNGQSLAGRRKAVSVGQPLVLLPAGADAEDRPAAADHVDRRDALRGEPGVAIRRCEHEVAESGPTRLGGERGQLRERLEDRRLLGRRIDLHVVVDPERLDAEVLGPPGDLDGPSPGRRGVHPEVLPIAALRQGQAELHSVAPSIAYVCSTSSRTRLTCSSVAGITFATVNHRPASRT